MLHAEQDALVQQANQRLVAIREEELKYYISIFTQFGVQGALFAGFTVQALTNVDAQDSPEAYWWKMVFWIGSAVVMVFSLHIVLGSTFINVYGSGLALRGKAGSLIRAVDGMCKELNPLTAVFLISVAAFQISALSICFILMTPKGAIACSGVFLFGLYYWYQGCMRIYNRFKADNVAWDVSRENSGPVEHNLVSGSFDSQDFTGIYNKQSLLAAAKERFNRDSGWVVPTTFRSDITLNFMEGYMGMKKLSRSFFSSNWSRYYFVLQKSDIFYYKHREDYLLHPKRTVTNRPLSVAGYYVMAAENMTSGLMEIILTPKDEEDERRVWNFHVDTVSECEQWMLAFEIACAQPAPHGSKH